MNTKTRRNILIAAAAVVAGLVLLSTAFGNSGTPTSVLTKDEATEILTNHLNGYNDGDYDAFTRDFAPELREVITEEIFAAFQGDAMTKLGPHLDIRNVRLEWGVMKGVVVWVADVNFEKEFDVEVRLGFKPDGKAIEGTHFQAAALEG